MPRTTSLPCSRVALVFSGEPKQSQIATICCTPSSCWYRGTTMLRNGRRLCAVTASGLHPLPVASGAMRQCVWHA